MIAGQVFLRLPLLALLLCIGFVETDAQERCGTEKAKQLIVERMPEVASRMAAAADVIFDEGGNSADKQPLQLTIPVVVHVVHNGEPVGSGANISAAQILSQIEVLNEDYRRLNIDAANTPSVFQSLAADIEIEFCLAVRTPDGAFTNGIERIDGGRSVWEIAAIDTVLKPSTYWDPERYLNIWTCNIGGADQGTLGFSSQIGQPANVDGVTVSYQYFGRGGSAQSPFDGGRTCTHEIGHWLGLLHIWGPSNPNANNCSDDDNIADTPVQNKANYGCPTFPRVSCSNGPNGDMFMNYMDYTNDNCMNLFTLGQKTVMYNTINNFRDSLYLSMACTQFQNDIALEEVLNPKDTTCRTSFKPVVKIRNVGTTTVNSFLISYTVNQSTFNQISWSGNDIQPGDVVYVVLPELNLAAGDNELDIYTDSPNNMPDQNDGNDGKNVQFYVQQSSFATFNLPQTEDFEDTWPGFEWSIIDVGNDGNTWVLDNTAGGFGESDNSASLTIGAGSVDDVDEFITPYYIAPDDAYPVLTFDMAYAPLTSTSNDVLTIYASFDCGQVWVPIWSKTGSDLVTAGSVSGSFIPTASDWRKEFVRFEGLAGQQYFNYKFSVNADAGNKIYIDNINILQYAVGVSEQAMAEDHFKLYPNPAANIVNVELFNSAMVSFYSLSGQQLLQERLLAGVGSIDVSELSPGLVIVRIATDNGKVTHQKLIIE